MPMAMGQATEQPNRVTTAVEDLYNKTKTGDQHRPTYPTHCAKKKSASGRQGLDGPRDNIKGWFRTFRVAIPTEDFDFLRAMINIAS